MMKSATSTKLFGKSKE